MDRWLCGITSRAVHRSVSSPEMKKERRGALEAGNRKFMLQLSFSLTFWVLSDHTSDHRTTSVTRTV
jgi:hypothetical protein